MMHPIYLPFTEQQLLSHFADVRQKGVCNKNDRHLKYYEDSVKRYDEYLANNPDRKSKSISDMRLPCQIEKDEIFWIATSMMTIFYSQSREQELTKLFRSAYGALPPVRGLNTGEECFGEDLYLFFEPNLPSPSSYKKWLFKDHTKRQFIPYVLDSARLYGYRFTEYKTNPKSLSKDLPHGKNCDWKNISRRLGWLTWEDFKNVNKDCCGWLK